MPRLNINWKLALVTALLFPLLLTLGFWQLDREQEKRNLDAVYEQRRIQPPLPLETIDWTADDLAFVRLVAEGEFLNERNFLLDNRILDSRIGYELITPLLTESGVVLVNRGWLPMGPSRQQLPELPPVEGTVTVQGSIYVAPGESFLLSDVQEQAAGQWPQVIQSIDSDAMATSLEDEVTAPVLPYTVRLENAQPGALQVEWPVISMSPATHRGYAVQWFTMAAVLLLLFVYISFRRDED